MAAPSKQQPGDSATIPAPRTALNDEDTTAKAIANKKAVRALTWCAIARNLGIMIRMQTETEIWLRAYAGDFAAQARMQGYLESIAGVIDFVISPLFGGLSDAIGRKPLMVMAPCFSLCTSVLLTLRPTVGSLAVRRLLMCFSSTPWHSGEAVCEISDSSDIMPRTSRT